MITGNNQYAIETFSLTKIFSDWWGRSKVVAVDELNLKIKYNEVFGFLGPNGSGKTTTLKMLLSLLHPTRGRSLMLGGDGGDPKITARIGYLPEESYLYRYLTARETLDFYGRLFGLPARVRKMRIDTLLDMAGLSAVANRQVGTFSKGMARRIGLAQALINDPELLILDEPTSGLDPIGTRQIKDLIIQLAKRGKTILLCSHLLADVEDVCDRIAILYGGRVQSEGYVKQLLQQSDKMQITTGALSESAVGRIKQIVESENGDCEVTSPIERLESFFIRIINKAQKEHLPTSGAVSTTQISDFLTAGGFRENILDKLVSAEVSAEPSDKPQEKLEPVASSHQPQYNDDLLKNLTDSATVVNTEPVTNIPAVTSETEADVDAGKNLLDELAGRGKKQASDADKGEPKDA